MKRKRNTKALSEFGKELREKQKLKNWYNLRERQFKSYVNEALEKQGQEDTGNLLIRILENRLDNVVFRSGLASSRSTARQIVNHGHFDVNGKKVDIPSATLKKGDVVSVREASKKKPYFQNITPSFKKFKSPSWIELNTEKFASKIVGEPSLVEAAPPAEVSAIFEFYSR
jgi:small subunit ribosomal protein S4